MSCAVVYLLAKYSVWIIARGFLPVRERTWPIFSSSIIASRLDLHIDELLLGCHCSEDESVWHLDLFVGVSLMCAWGRFSGFRLFVDRHGGLGGAAEVLEVVRKMLEVVNGVR